jgi:hypothetical protein
MSEVSCVLETNDMRFKLMAAHLCNARVKIIALGETFGNHPKISCAIE